MWDSTTDSEENATCATHPGLLTRQVRLVCLHAGEIFTVCKMLSMNISQGQIFCGTFISFFSSAVETGFT